MTWTLTEDLNVMPNEDFREHEASINCWCHPIPDAEQPTVIVHNSMDQRELYERGDLKAH